MCFDNARGVLVLVPGEGLKASSDIWTMPLPDTGIPPERLSCPASYPNQRIAGFCTDIFPHAGPPNVEEWSWAEIAQVCL